MIFRSFLMHNNLRLFASSTIPTCQTSACIIGRICIYLMGGCDTLPVTYVGTHSALLHIYKYKCNSQNEVDI